jgi:hypothetical protein
MIYTPQHFNLLTCMHDASARGSQLYWIEISYSLILFESIFRETSTLIDEMHSI